MGMAVYATSEQVRAKKALSAFITQMSTISDDIYEPNTYHMLIESFISVLESRDSHTAAHSLRVGTMTQKTCSLLELPQRSASIITMAAYMHDIGKVGLPDEVLIRHGRLTPQDHVTLRTHPQMGHEILSSCESLHDVAEIVLHHHERWDGLGYPGHLIGAEIPLGSRIISICDSIDAMLGKRIHSKAISKEQCKNEISQNRGTKYDPSIADLVLDYWIDIVLSLSFIDSFSYDRDRYKSLSCTVPYLTDFRHRAS